MTLKPKNVKWFPQGYATENRTVLRMTIWWALTQDMPVIPVTDCEQALWLTVYRQSEAEELHNLPKIAARKRWGTDLTGMIQGYAITAHPHRRQSSLLLSTKPFSSRALVFSRASQALSTRPVISPVLSCWCYNPPPLNRYIEPTLDSIQPQLL